MAIVTRGLGGEKALLPTAGMGRWTALIPAPPTPDEEEITLFRGIYLPRLALVIHSPYLSESVSDPALQEVS